MGYFRVVVSYRMPGISQRITITPGIEAQTPEYAELEAKAMAPFAASDVRVEGCEHLGEIHNANVG